MGGTAPADGGEVVPVEAEPGTGTEEDEAPTDDELCDALAEELGCSRPVGAASAADGGEGAREAEAMPVPAAAAAAAASPSSGSFSWDGFSFLMVVRANDVRQIQ